MMRSLVAAVVFSGTLLITSAVPSAAYAADTSSPGETRANSGRADEAQGRAGKQPPHVNQLLQELRGPQDHDRVTKQMGMDALLLNPHFSSQVETPLGQALYIPRQISERDAGRKSLYFIKPGEEVMAGIYIIDSTIYYRVVRRDTGRATPAQTGDLFTEVIMTQANEVVTESQGTLTVLDPSKGVGVFDPIDKSTAGFKWWAWSFYAEMSAN